MRREAKEAKHEHQGASWGEEKEEVRRQEEVEKSINTPNAVLVSVVESVMVAEEMETACTAVVSDLVILVDTELAKGLWEIMVERDRGGSGAGKLGDSEIERMVRPASVEHVDDDVLPFVGGVMSRRRLVTLGSRRRRRRRRSGLIPVTTLDPVLRGIDTSNDVTCQRVTCHVLKQGLGTGIVGGEHDTHEGLCLVKTGLDGINVTLGWSTLPRGSEEGAGCVRRRLCDEPARTWRENIRTGVEHGTVLAAVRSSRALALAFGLAALVTGCQKKKKDESREQKRREHNTTDPYYSCGGQYGWQGEEKQQGQDHHRS